MASLWSKIKGLFGGRDDEPVPYQGPRPAGIGTFPSYQSATNLLGTYGSPESYREQYYKDIFQPTAKARRRQFETRELPQIESQFGRMNIASTPQAAGLLMQRRGDIESELSQFGGELRAKGFETGLGERARQLGGYQQLLGAERGQQGAQAQFGWQNYINQLQQAEAIRTANRGVIPGMITSATGLGDIGMGAYDLATGNKRWEELLRKVIR